MAASMLTERETAFFEDVHTMMKKSYPDLADQFGIWRVHQHFQPKEDEIFHETSNPETKESTLRLIKKSELPQNAFPSTWTLSEKGPVVASWCCDYGTKKP